MRICDTRAKFQYDSVKEWFQKEPTSSDDKTTSSDSNLKFELSQQQFLKKQ